MRWHPAIARRARITGARIHDQPWCRDGGAGSGRGGRRLGYRPLALVFRRSLRALPASRQVLVLKAGDGTHVTLSPRFHLAVNFFDRVRTLLSDAGTIAGTALDQHPGSPAQDYSAGSVASPLRHWHLHRAETVAAFRRDVGRSSSRGDQSLSLPFDSDPRGTPRRELPELAVSSWQWRVLAASEMQRRGIAKGVSGSIGGGVHSRVARIVKNSRQSHQRRRLFTGSGVADAHMAARSQPGRPESIPSAGSGRVGKPGSPEVGTRMARRAATFLPVRSPQQLLAPHSRAVATVERVFRDSVQKAPPVADARPGVPLPPPQIQRIDMDQLDRDLWRRFEKRIRVERERRGRL